MKKLMLVFVVSMMAVALVAAGKVSYQDAAKELGRLLTVEKNAVAAQAYIADIDWTVNDSVKGSFVNVSWRIDLLNKVVPNSIDEAKATIAKYAAVVGLTDKDVMAVQVMNLLYASQKSQLCYDFYKSFAEAPAGVKSLVRHACTQLKKYDEALAINLQMGDYVSASLISANYLKDKAKTFEYCKKAMLDQYLTAPVLVQVLDRVGSFDYADTSVTKDMQKDLLLAVDLKYRRFLVKDKQTWEPIIAGIRLTLQGYGVEVK